MGSGAVGVTGWVMVGRGELAEWVMVPRTPLKPTAGSNGPPANCCGNNVMSQ